LSRTDSSSPRVRPSNRGKSYLKTSVDGGKIRIRDEHPKLFFPELRNSFLGKKKYLKFFDADPNSGSGIFLPWIRDPV
jgi:hypothetical protein